MLIALCIAILVGILFGIITGLTPGVHINLVAALLVAYASYFLTFADGIVLSCFIISMSITHTFLDNIPSTFLGAPESATALGVLPGHRYLLKGKGYTAVKLSLIGSLFGLWISILLFPLLVPLVQIIYPLLEPFIGWILVCVVFFMIVRDSKWPWALVVFFSSGILGILVFSLPSLNSPLFPLLSGFFGVSTLLISMNDNEHIPKQRTNQSLKIDTKIALKSVASGTFSGWLTALFPGLSSGIAAVISLQITKKLGDYGFMMLTGAIQMVNFVLSLATFYALNKARNGSVIAIQSLLSEISIINITIFLSVSLISAAIAIFLALHISKMFSKLITKINYRVLILSIIGFIILLTLMLSSWIGILVLLSSTAIGLIPGIQKTARTHSMGCLLLPVIIYFLL
jgi:putative membrane protein